MAHRSSVPLLTTPLDPRGSVPLYRQLYQRLRQAILSGSLAPGVRLPSTRTLAGDLAIARNTVLSAYEQLLAEGYLEGTVGSGTYVSRALPEHLLHAPADSARLTRRMAAPTLSHRGRALAELPGPRRSGPAFPEAFRTGLPACDQFPFEIWARLSARRWRARPSGLLGYGDPAGYRPLREAIAGYLGTARGVRCHPDQILVVSGSQQALDLAARLLLDPGDAACVEDPGYAGARGALAAAGARLVPIPVDDEGLDVVRAARGRPVRLICVTPSRQYPLGATMSIARRLALLEWATNAGAWVLEDDYDSEYRYAGRPLAALQGLDTTGRVIYLGTFSKVLFPSLRLGYLIVPTELIEPFVRARSLTDWHGPTVPQAVVADFINEGHFLRHIRRMRMLYAQRQETLVDAAQRELEGWLEVHPAEAGMHLVGWLPAGVSDQQAAARAASQGVHVTPLSVLASRPLPRGGLLLGYTALDGRRIRDGLRRLAMALRSHAVNREQKPRDTAPKALPLREREMMKPRSSNV